MKKIPPFISFIVSFTAVALTGAFAQSPEIPEGPIIQLVGTFDYPGTGNQTRPQKISDNFAVVGIFVDPSGVSRGFIMFMMGTLASR